MCNTNNAPSPPPLPHNHNPITRNNYKNTPYVRRARTKTRKPKFLSLRLQLISSSSSSFSASDHKSQPNKMTHQLDLFPLHPEKESSVHDRDNINNMVGVHDDNSNVEVEFLFESDGDATLNGLLGGEPTTPTAITTPASTGALSISEEDSFSPPSLTYGSYDPITIGGVHDNASSLVRTAMRSCKDRDAEERWVSYSEVVEKRPELLEEVTSHCLEEDEQPLRRRRRRQPQLSLYRRSSNTTASTTTTTSFNGKKRTETAKFGSLSLKLDYDGIMNAWSDKGPLYVQQGEAGEFPQTVPDYATNDCAGDVWGSGVGDIWNVPEWGSENMSKNVMEGKEELIKGREGWKTGQREASVLRYKEKRQSRLFSKRIRYEVRKLNAEKRPRMKGRFVKRNS